MSWKIKILSLVLVLGFPLFAQARTFEWSFPSSNVVRIHLTASSFDDLISPGTNCGSNSPGSWSIFASAPDVGQFIHDKSNYADITEDITLPDDTYENIYLNWGNTATDWNNLYNVQSCAAQIILAESFTIPHTASSTGGGTTTSTIESTGTYPNPLILIPILAGCAILFRKKIYG